MKITPDVIDLKQLFRRQIRCKTSFSYDEDLLLYLIPMNCLLSLIYPPFNEKTAFLYEIFIQLEYFKTLSYIEVLIIRINSS